MNHVNLDEPELRFPAFSDNWSQKQMKDICVVSQGLQIPISERFTENDEGRYFYITNEFLKENTEKEYYIENPPKSVICTEKDVLMTRTGNTGKVITNVNGVFHNNFFKIGYDDSIIDKDFLCYFLNNFNTQKTIMRLAGTSTIPDLNHKDFYSIKINFPSLLEQRKISDFLIKIDKKIELLEKKLVLHRNFNESLKVKIFSNINSKNIKLKTFLKESKIPHEDDINKRLTVKLNLKGITKREIKANEKEGATTQYLRKEGQFIYGKQNLHKGAFGIIPKELDGYLSSNDIPSFDFTNELINPFWFYYYFSRKSFYENLERFSSGTGSKRISPKDFLNIKIPIKDLEQQNQDADLLKKLNNKENIMKKEICSFNAFKKALLQKMFV